jgi:hypothetical protein
VRPVVVVDDFPQRIAVGVLRDLVGVKVLAGGTGEIVDRARQRAVGKILLDRGLGVVDRPE